MELVNRKVNNFADTEIGLNRAKLVAGSSSSISEEKPEKEVSKEEYKVYKAYKAVHDKEAETIKKGYNRIKVRNIRQDYLKAVISGTWSGSRKGVTEHYDDSATIWGG